MIGSWNAIGDFAEVIDTLEAVTHIPNGCPEQSLEASGWRFREELSNDSGIPAPVVRTDVTWQLSLQVDQATPRPGDLIVDGKGGCSTVRVATRLQGGTRFLCEAVRLTIANGASERFDLLRPVWIDGSEGPIVDRVDRLRPALMGYFDSDPDVAGQSGSVTLFLTTPQPLQAGDWIDRHRGGRYEITSVVSPQAIGEAWRIDLMKLNATV